MKIKRLDLLAFAHFTERSLEFEGGNFHIVYGPNEAGKSSSLRALKFLLFGIDARTTDNFLHKHARLRLGGWLENRAGDELEFLRRKGNKNTLLTPAGELLDDGVLAPFLSGVNRDVFSSLFGIDHQALQQGGEEILQQKGELGQMLFSAAIGSQALHGVLKQLDEEADALFRPRASTRKINQLLGQYKDLEKAIRESSGSASQWRKRRDELDKTTTALKATEQELAGLRKEVNLLERIQRILPGLAQRREVLQQLDVLQNVVSLAEDFSTRFRQATHQLDTARLTVQKAEPKLERLEAQRKALDCHEELVEQAETVTEVYAQLEQYRQGIRDLPVLEAERKQRRADAKTRLHTIRPDLELEAADSLRQILVHRQPIAERAKEKQELDSRAAQIAEAQRKLDLKLKQSREEKKALPSLIDGKALQLAVTQARKAGDIDRHIREAESHTLQQRCEDERLRLGFTARALNEVPRLAMPDRERVAEFESLFATQAQTRQRLLEEQARVERQLREAEIKIEEIQRTGAVPTENELQQSREARDALWQLLRRQWVDQEDISGALERLALQEPLPDEFERKLQIADELSDRLRREAKRVHELVESQLKQEVAQRELADSRNRLRDLDRETALQEKRWTALWSEIRPEPGTPAEMRNWLEAVARLREQIGRLQEVQTRVTALKNHRDEARNRLARSLGGTMSLPEAELLAPLLQLAEDRLAEMERLRQQHEALEKEIGKLNVERDELLSAHGDVEHEIAAWEGRWTTLLGTLALPSDTQPSQAMGFIQTVQELFQFKGEAEKLQMRIDAINTTIRQFQQKVENMLPALAPQLRGLPVDDAVVKLNARLLEAQKRAAQQQEIEQQIAEIREELEASRLSQNEAEKVLQGLCGEARCKTFDELETCQRQAAEKRRLMDRLRALETMLLEQGRGIELAKLEQEAAAVDPDSLPGEIAALTNRIDNELEPRRTGLAETRGREERELELMDGGDKAAVLADQAQSLLAAIRSESGKYIRVRLAGRILRDEIERYRQQNQGPLVSRADSHFAKLTLGSFSGLKTDLNEKDEPILVGVRPDGQVVDVTGMSSGTRDQLYLALRLASLEKYMEGAEPMPFIVDDILVDFDDRRSEAALEALNDLAEKTQVILFTHHASVVAQARALPTHVNVLEL